MDLALQIMKIVSMAVAIVLAMVDIRDKLEERWANKATKLPITQSKSTGVNHGPRVASIIALIIGFPDLLFVMYGPHRDMPLTGATGALLAYGLFFIFMGFYLRQR